MTQRARDSRSHVMHVKSIALVKFRTPMICQTLPLADRNGSHWGVVINNDTLVHFISDARSQFGIKIENWAPGEYISAPTPCEPYEFPQARTITIHERELLEIPSVNCHKVCQKIFRLVEIDIMTGEEAVANRLKNTASAGLGVFALGIGSLLTAGGAALFTLVGVGAIGYGAKNCICEDRGHDGPNSDD